MYCPECGAEFRMGIDECYDCGVPLGPDPPAEPKVEKYVTILETSELSVIPILKTVLEGARIPFRTRGEGLMRIYPSNAHGALLHASAGEVKFRVAESRADEARELLSTTATVEEEPEAEAEAPAEP